MRPRARPPEVVLVGHVGFATDRTPGGTVSYPGGSGYAAAFAASALLGDRVGLVTQVGPDFNVDSLRRLGVNMAGVSVLPGASAVFFIDQLPGGRLSFRSELGVAAKPRVDLFPARYLQARYLHLGSAPPRQQLAWLEFLRGAGCRARVSVDMFEPFVAADPGACRAACERADLLFLNDAEYRELYDGSPPHAPAVVKRGAGGAEYLAAPVRHRVPAPPADEVDPVGAGEILAGVFLALRARGLPENRALSHAVTAATASVTEFGVAGPAVTGVLRRLRDELEARRIVRDPTSLDRN
jgi:sugar/nucleoside kinase (ribokinase family)